MKKTTIAALVALAATSASVSAQDKKAAAAPDHVDTRMCIGCHGIPGYKTAFPEVYHVPKIGGQQPGYIVNALKAYKSGERWHPSMRAIAASLSEEQMAAYAAYYGEPAK